MNVKLVISEKALRTILESNGEMVIGQAEQFFPCDKNDETEPMIEFFISDIFNENDMMSVLMRRIDSHGEELSTGYVVQRKKYVLAQKSIKFRKEGKDTL